MKDNTKKQEKALETVEKNLTAKRTQWLAAYDQAKAARGSVVLEEGSTIRTIWEELLVLRAQKNDLLVQMRAEGKNI